jgi:hypothetical protein
MHFAERAEANGDGRADQDGDHRGDAAGGVRACVS